MIEQRLRMFIRDTEYYLCVSFLIHQTLLFLVLRLNHFNLTQAKFEQAKNMYFLDNTPSENRMEFTKQKVACKYASIERGCASF